MAELILAGVPPYDGRWPLDLEREFTTREWGWVKRLAGYLPLTLNDEAFSDPELACVLAVIVLHRAGKVERADVPAVYDRLIDAPFGSALTIETDDTDEQESGDAGPPVASSNGSSATSGGDSATSSETSPANPPTSGIPDSATSRSGPPTLVT